MRHCDKRGIITPSIYSFEEKLKFCVCWLDYEPTDQSTESMENNGRKVPIHFILFAFELYTLVGFKRNEKKIRVVVMKKKKRRK